jgi:translation initiation factor 2 subunit 3
LCYFKV